MGAPTVTTAQRFDHLVVAVADLETATEAYRTLGFDVRPGGRHTGRGTYNAIVRFGLDYLELISVYDEEEAERAGRGDLVAFLRRHPGGLVAYALATADIDGARRQLAAAGLDAVGPFAMERVRPDGRRLAWRLLVPGGTPYRRPWPFLIQWDQADAERLAWEAPGSHANSARTVVEVGVVVGDLGRGIDLYQRQLGLPLQHRDAAPEVGAERAVFPLDGFRIVLLAPAGPGATAETLEALGEGPSYAVLRVASLEAARRALATGGVRVAPAPEVPGGLAIEADRAGRARLVLSGPP